jgi:hypothetical protein
MRRICAWCTRDLDQPDGRVKLQVTHGVCEECRRKFFGSSKAKEADSRSSKEDGGDDAAGLLLK